MKLSELRHYKNKTTRKQGRLEILVFEGPHLGRWVFRKRGGDVYKKCMKHPLSPLKNCHVRFALRKQLLRFDKKDHMAILPYLAAMEGNKRFIGYPCPYFHINMAKAFRGKIKRRIIRAAKGEENTRKFWNKLFPRMDPKARNEAWKMVNSEFINIKSLIVFEKEIVPGFTKNHLNNFVTLWKVAWPIPEGIVAQIIITDMPIEVIDLHRFNHKLGYFYPPNVVKVTSKKRIIEIHDELSDAFLTKDTSDIPFPDDDWDMPPEFKHLDNAKKLKAEGIKMHHCAAGYVSDCKYEGSKIYHVTMDNEMATMEVKGGVIRQLRGVCNGDPSVEMWRMVNSAVAEAKKKAKEKEEKALVEA